MSYLDNTGLAYFWSKLKALFAAKQDTLVSGTNIKTVGGQSLLGAGDIPMTDQEAVKFTTQTLTDAQKAQALANIGAAPEDEVAALADQKYEGPYASTAALPTASASTIGAIYLVGPDSNGEYDRYVTKVNGSTYTWESLGKTSIDLSNYATKAEVDELEAKVSEISGQFYGVFASASDLPSGIVNNGYAYIGSQEPYELYIFDGTSWTDTESTVEGVHFIDNELSIGTVVEGNTADAQLTGDAPNQILDLTIPRAGNPYKGLFPDFASLKASGNATEGDYAYVQDPSPATTASIYRYDSTASSDNYWADSGIDTDFGSPIVVPFTEYAKNTILYVMSKVAWINQNGQDYLDLLHDALLLKNVVSIEATFTQGTDYFGTNSALDELKADLVVVATYDDASTSELESHEYELSGTLTHGTSTITVTYQGKTDTFTVTVVSYVLEKSQFVCYGLTGRYQPRTPGPYPYTDGSISTRFSYPFFDLSVVAGKTYLFTYVSSVNTLNIGVQGYTQAMMNTIASHGNFTDPTDSGWQNSPLSYTIPSGVLAIRVTGRIDSTNPQVTEVPIERLIIDEVD